MIAFKQVRWHRLLGKFIEFRREKNILTIAVKALCRIVLNKWKLKKDWNVCLKTDLMKTNKMSW